MANKTSNYVLVQYIMDDVYHVVSSQEIKKVRKKNKIFIRAKYCDGWYYNAKIVARHPIRKVLEEIAQNIINNVPLVILNHKEASLTECDKRYEDIINSDIIIETIDLLGEHQIENPLDEFNILTDCRKNDEDINSNIIIETFDELQIGNLQHILGDPVDQFEISTEFHKKDEDINSNIVIDTVSEHQTGNPLDEFEILDEALQHNIVILDNTVVVPGQPIVVEKRSEPQGKKNKKSSQKRHCCYYCYKLVFKIYRHYASVHKHEKEVRELLALPVKSTHRKQLLDNLRKKGDFIFNTQKKSENDKMIVCRKTSGYKTEREKNVPCPNCKGYYSKFSIRHHVQRCMPRIKKTKGRVNIQAECRKLGNSVHRNCSDDLKNKVLPFLNEDEVSNAIRYDEAVVTYGNYLCRKYTTPHLYAQIRSNIRALGRLILAIKQINPSIQNLYDVLDVCHIELIIKGIDEVAGLDKSTNLYRAPATAMLLSTELKRACKLLQMEFLKTGNKEGQKRMENVLTIFNLEFHVTVNKKGLNTQKLNNRKKKIVLPKTDQIAEFRTYLENNVRYYISKLSKKYRKEDWVHLTEYTLAHLAVFNRKRPGETQRILIDDFKNHEVMNDEEITDHLDKEQVKKWARIRLTGKLGKNTALLVHRNFGFTAINLILKYREISGVPVTNKYVFGAPSQFHSQNTFQACKLIREFSESSGVENPHLLRTRLLRQHFATETATAEVDNRLEGRVSDFMSHKRKIHEDYYVMTQKCDDITKVSKLLENFSTSAQVITSPSNSPRHQESPSDSDSSSEPENLTQAEINYVMGTRKSRHSWQAEEKKTAIEHFYEEIFCGATIERKKVNQFYESNKSLYKYRTPHLIMQWIKNEHNRVVETEKGKIGKRLRWSTPEKEILRFSTERHSAECTNPSVPECELLRQQNLEILENRSAEAIKSYIYAEVKRLSNVE